MFHFHKYEKINKKIYIPQEILLGDKKYEIYDLYKCKNCGKILYKLVYRHYTYKVYESIKFEQKLRDLDVQSNMDYLLNS